MSKDTLHALELSIVPAVLASSCCLTLPALALIGLSFGETTQLFNPSIMRIVALIILFLSLVYYFYKKGISTKQDYIDNKRIIIAIVLQTLFFAILIYVISLYIITPIVCDITGLNTCSL